MGMDFDTWFELLVTNLQEEHGIFFNDPDSVRDDYDQGKDVMVVVEEIREEYEI